MLFSYRFQLLNVESIFVVRVCSMGGFLDPWFPCQGTNKDGSGCNRMAPMWRNGYCHSHRYQAPESPPPPIEFYSDNWGTLALKASFKMMVSAFLISGLLNGEFELMFESLFLSFFAWQMYEMSFKPFLEYTVIHHGTDEWRKLHEK